MIEVEKLRKTYNGTRGLDGFSLKVEEGELFGLVGPNGAGKTTLIKILSTLIRADAGEARLAGYDLKQQPREVKRLLGYLPDQPGLYQDMRVREFLEFFADAFHMRRQRQRAAIDAALGRAGLASRSQSFVEELSFGMKQRLLLAKTLLHSPKVLLLDEPATGLDPLARIELRQQLKALNREGITILISSHILSDLEDICTRVALIADGRNAADERGHAIIELQKPAEGGHVYEMETLEPTETLAKAIEEFAGARVLESKPGRALVEISSDPAEAARLLRHLVTAGLNVVRFDRPASALEERYRQVFGGKSK